MVAHRAFINRVLAVTPQQKVISQFFFSVKYFFTYFYEARADGGNRTNDLKLFFSTKLVLFSLAILLNKSRELSDSKIRVM